LHPKQPPDSTECGISFHKSPLNPFLSLPLLSGVLQGQFDGVLDEDTVAEGLHKLGRSAAGSEYVYLNLLLSVSISKEHHCKVLLCSKVSSF